MWIIQKWPQSLKAARRKHGLSLLGGEASFPQRDTHGLQSLWPDGWSIALVLAGHNPIEYLWRKAKKEATHDKYFAAFEHLAAPRKKTGRK